MAEKIKTLIRQRAAYKAVLTKIGTWIKNLDVKKENSILIQRKRKSLTELQEKMEGLFFELIEGSEESEVENVEKDYDKFAENFGLVWEALSKKLEQIKELSKSAELTVRQGTENSTSVSENSDSDSEEDDKKDCQIVNVKLPEINLKKFDGQLDKWIEFYETFQILIHNNSKLKDIQKYYYLKSCLEGEAAESIDSIKISEENYEFAWKTLVKQYKNNKTLVEFHVNNIFKANKVDFATGKALRDLLQVFQKNLNALKKLGIKVEHCDVFLIYLFTSKLDKFTLKAWEETSSGTQLSSFASLEEFMKKRCLWLSSYENKQSEMEGTKKGDKFGGGCNKKGKVGSCKGKFSNEGGTPGRAGCLSACVTHLQESEVTKENNKQTSGLECSFCGVKEHNIFKCNQFLKLSVNDKREAVQKKGLCWVCIKGNHRAAKCNREKNCKHCQGRHNSLLCRKDELEINKTNLSENSDNKISGNNLAAVTAHCVTEPKPNNLNPITKGALLPTAVVILDDNTGYPHQARFILDSGSQLNFLSKKIVTQLNLKTLKEKREIKGIGNTSLTTVEAVELILKSCISEFKRKVKFYVVPECTYYTNSQKLQITDNSLPENIKRNLADKEFENINKQVDGLLGASLFFDVILAEKYYALFNNSPFMFLKTKLGWVCAGDDPNERDDLERNCLLTLNSNRNSTLSKLAKVKQDQNCEENFVKTITKGTDGKFIVSLPMVTSPKLLGDSYEGASRRFLSLEQRLAKNKELKRDYVQFMREYLMLGHMELVPSEEINKDIIYYLPHHAVLRDSITTKLRVVFDASFKTNNGVSLNDILMPGPSLQNDIFRILIQFRFHKYGLTGDVMKMYRQIWVNPQQWDLQRIVWRESPELPLQHYRLKTVTYGTSTAPYLAIRCLLETANEIKGSNPELANVIRNNFYMDDFIGGADNPEDLINLQKQLTNELNKRGFLLRKFATNSLDLKAVLPQEEEGQVYISLGNEDVIKALGLMWNTHLDEFVLRIHNLSTSELITKRKIVSDLHSFWDPLGFLSPILIKGRCFVQELWKLKLGWDEALPDALQKRWVNFRDSIKEVNLMTLPRRVIIGNRQIELHGFCDASEKAYGGCIYAISRENGNCSSQLLCAKAKVASLESGSLPRLELMAASLVHKLMDTVVQAVNKSDMKIYYWSDSEIVLSWIGGYPREWKAFVANRVALIRETSTPEQWNYVPSKQNPADLVSRGVQPKAFKEKEFWWHGPEWLRKDKNSWPLGAHKTLEEIPERRKLTFSLVVLDNSFNFIDKYSSWVKLLHVTAYIFRFIRNSRNRAGNRKTGILMLSEINDAKIFILQVLQGLEFPEEKSRLERNLQIKRNSRLASLAVFLDGSGLLRVGGRLQYSELATGNKNPIVLPYKSHVTQIIIYYYHKIYGHVGPQVLLSIVRENYWPINGKSACKAVVHMCVVCRRNNASPIYPKMAPLPKPRVTPGRPFDVCGVDFCGPVWIKAGTRKSTKKKAYIALFICFKVKAVSIELVSDLTSAAFIAALRRFYAKRGVSAHIYSDNGTNFVGAQRELRKFVKDAGIQEECVRVGTEWHFIPAGSPHMGGIWESAIKLLKTHLRKTLKADILTFEEFYTLLAQIEAILNSRPLCPLSDDPSDPTPLTPGHFLVGSSLLVPNDTNLVEDMPVLTRWQRIQQLLQIFWRRWSLEYLSSLQVRHKWKFPRGGIPIGTLVAVKENDLPPANWKLARIKELHPGSDGIARVATVKMGNGTITQRPMVKLCPILTEESANPEEEKFLTSSED